ncbi:hypothetical protein NMG60_11034786 [Bertholletia excelsa]
MFPAVVMSNSANSEAGSVVPAGDRISEFSGLNPMISTNISAQQTQKIKKKRNLPGNPDPDAEVIALSPKTLLTTNRFVCEVCNKGFQRDQNLQLHRRGHNLPWKLKQRSSKERRKKAYVCPEPTCVHHHPSRALGDLTGIKKHYCRKHGEKKWKCEKCSKIYAVHSDWKAHSKTCGTREYRCDCGTLFSRKDSFITHRAFCEALAEESARLSKQLATAINPFDPQNPPPLFHVSTPNQTHFPNPNQAHISINPFDPNRAQNLVRNKPQTFHLPIPPPLPPISSAAAAFFREAPTTISVGAATAHLSATALLQKATALGAHPVGHVASGMALLGSDDANGMPPDYVGFGTGNLATWQESNRLTRDFLGLTGICADGGGDSNSGVGANVNMRNLLSFTGGVELPTCERERLLLKGQVLGFAEANGGVWRDKTVTRYSMRIESPEN